MNTLNYTLKDQGLPSTWQMLLWHLSTKRNRTNIQRDSIKTLNPLGTMKATSRKFKLTKVDFKVLYEKQKEKN